MKTFDHVLDLSISLDAPALLAITPPAANLSRTLPFVPGNALRGVLARRALDTGMEGMSDPFTSLFLGDQVRYGFGRKDGAEAIPLSSRSCKYDPGFLGGEEGSSVGHGVEDGLLFAPSGEGCSRCKAPLEPYSGQWRSEGRGPETSKTVEVHRRLITRNAVDPVRGTAAKGQLYSQEVIDEGQTFHARIHVAEESLWESLCKLVGQPFDAEVGGGSSRGQGWATVALREASAAPASPASSSARSRFQAFRKVHEKPVLALTLLSDALFFDNYLRPAGRPGPRDLQALGLNPKDWDLTPEAAFVGERRVAGFDGVPILLPALPSALSPPAAAGF